MIKFYGHIENFWADDLKSFVFPAKYSAGQQSSFHENYSYSTNDLPQAFATEVPYYKKFMEVLNIETAMVSWTCIEPGQAIPIHSDSFYKLRQLHNVPIEQCLRYLIFLQDWQLGHFVEFEETIITKWSAGDVWMFDHKSMHCAVNASNNNFITCQVSTIV
jgi:hypothetical protein